MVLIKSISFLKKEKRRMVGLGFVAQIENEGETFSNQKGQKRGVRLVGMKWAQHSCLGRRPIWCWTNFVRVHVSHIQNLGFSVLVTAAPPLIFFVLFVFLKRSFDSSSFLQDARALTPPSLAFTAVHVDGLKGIVFILFWFFRVFTVLPV